MPELELSAGPIEYEDTGGDGPTIVFSHGLFMDGSQWRHVVADLRRDYRCVLPTLPLGAHRQPMRADADTAARSGGLGETPTGAAPTGVAESSPTRVSGGAR